MRMALVRLGFVFFFAALGLESLSLAREPWLDDLLEFHPTWITRTWTSHDPSGGNADGSFWTGERMQYDGRDFAVVFRDLGEGRISRILMSASDEDQQRDYQRMVILVDGRVFYDGRPGDFFRNPDWKPLVYEMRESSGSFVSYLPIPYQNQAILLFDRDPHYWQVEARSGLGASVGPSAEELKRVFESRWWDTSAWTHELDLSQENTTVLANGPGTVEELELRCEGESRWNEWEIQVGTQDWIPFAFFFGVGVSGGEETRGIDGTMPQLKSAYFFVDRDRCRFRSRLPVPLGENEQLRIRRLSGVRSGVGSWRALLKKSDSVSDAKLVTQFRDQRGSGRPETMKFFETSGASAFLGLVEEITEGRPGHRGFFEGDEIVRFDGLAAPWQLGTGTEEYFGGGWYFWGAFSNFLSGLVRFVANNPEEGWKNARFEHSLYREHAIDPLIARSGMSFGFEAGEDGSYQPIRYRTLALGYEFPRFRENGRVSVEFAGAEKERRCLVPDAEKSAVAICKEGVRSSNGAGLRALVPCPRGATDQTDGDWLAVVAYFDLGETIASEVGLDLCLGGVCSRLRPLYRNALRRLGAGEVVFPLSRIQCSGGSAELRIEAGSAWLSEVELRPLTRR